MSKQLSQIDVAAVEQSIMASIELADLAPSTKKKYRRAVRRFLATGAKLTDAEALAAHAAELPASGRAFLKAAIGKWAAQMIVQIKGVPAGDVAEVMKKQEVIFRFEALQDAIQGEAPAGQKGHIWLSAAEVKHLMSLPGDDLAGKRDRAALGLLVGAGLRRREAVELTFSDAVMKPVKERSRTVLQVQGKGGKNREVPISDRLAAALNAWGNHVAGRGNVLRSVANAGAIGDSLSPVGLFKIVRRYGARMGQPELAPHDLRRTYAQIGYDSGVAIIQISKLLGHASVATTQRYLNLDLDLETTISDFVPM